MKSCFPILIFLVSAAFGAVPARATMDWADLCAPDEVALAQAAKDYPSDRYGQSSCADSVYLRGVCEVRPQDVPPAGASAQEQVLFHVRLRSDAGLERSYQILMALSPGEAGARASDVCRVREVRRAARAPRASERAGRARRGAGR